MNIKNPLRRVKNTGLAIVLNRTPNVDVDSNLGEFTETLGSVGRNILLGNATSRAIGIVVGDGNTTGLPQSIRESKVNGITDLIKYFDRISRRQRSLLESNLAHKISSVLACAWITRQLKRVSNNLERCRRVSTSSTTF